MVVDVNGSLESLQSSIDFFLIVTSKDCVSDSNIMRNRFFSIFSKEDEYREENLLKFVDRVTGDYEINFDCEPDLVGEEEIYDCSDSDLVWGSLEDEEVKSEIENSVVDEYSNNLEEENLELDDEDDDDFINWGSSDDEDEDTDEEDEDTIEEDDVVEDDFSSWGSSDEDEIVEDDEDEVEEEDDDFSNWDSSDDEEDVEDEDETWSNWGNSDEEGAEEEEDTLDDGIEDVFGNWGSDEEESVEDSQWGTDEIEKEVITKDDDDFWDTFEAGVSDNVQEQEDIQVSVQEKPKVKEESNFSVTKDIPRDLREFVKMYPNCEMSFAMKYFSKRDIDKQLSLGRVFKRKNRLLI